jgi:hypothetical protein
VYRPSGDKNNREGTPRADPSYCIVLLWAALRLLDNGPPLTIHAHAADPDADGGRRKSDPYRSDWSDLAFLAWERLCGTHEIAVANLKHVLVPLRPNSSATASTVDAILGRQQQDRPILQSNKLTYDTTSAGLGVMLGLEAGVPFLLLQHQDVLGVRFVSQVKLWRQTPDMSCVLFAFSDTQENMGEAVERGRTLADDMQRGGSESLSLGGSSVGSSALPPGWTKKGPTHISDKQIPFNVRQALKQLEISCDDPLYPCLGLVWESESTPESHRVVLDFDDSMVITLQARLPSDYDPQNLSSVDDSWSGLLWKE